MVLTIRVSWESDGEVFRSVKVKRLAPTSPAFDASAGGYQTFERAACPTKGGSHAPHRI